MEIEEIIRIDKKKRRKALTIKIAIVFFVFIGIFIVNEIYTIDTVRVEGNIHYTNEEIIDMVIMDQLSQNSLYLSLKYRNKKIENIPFIETIDIQIISPNAIHLTCYEKSTAGYVEHLGKNMYFDKDGIIVESSPVKTEGIPEVAGLQFDYLVLHEKLPIESEEVFQEILNITQMLEKYELTATKIYFDKNYEITLYFDNVRAKLGVGDHLNDKILKLGHILPNLEGKSGVVRMENYTLKDTKITFEYDKE